MNATQVRLMRGVLLPLTLLVVWQVWGTATGNPRTPVPTRVAAAAVDLYWLPLGAGGHSVRLNGRVFEAAVSRIEHRPACDLYHSALEVLLKEHGSGVTDSRQCGSTGANRDRDAQSLYRQRRKKRPVSSRACRSAAWESPMRSPTPLFSLPPTRRPLLPATCFPSMAGSRQGSPQTRQ